MVNLNFANIRHHEGSQNTGFEELVCQLARLQKPESGVRFVKKAGAGGDAGVECYWILTDESEVCWQAKYFPDGMNSSRWQQLNESFNTALEKHPNLTTYVICLPLDKSDSRKKGKGGKQVVSVEDEWIDHVKKWTEVAKKQGRSVGFVFWGKHEITSFLSIDDPLYSGRALYWFNEPVLGFDTFKQIAQKARDSLGDRYTPEFHVDLPIVKNFDGLCLNEQWWEELEEKIAKLDEQRNQFFKAFTEDKPDLLDKNKIGSLKSVCSEVFRVLSESLNTKNTHFKVQNVREIVDEISKYYDVLYNGLYTEKIQGNKDYGVGSNFGHFAS